MTLDINWYALWCDASTSIRRDFTINVLDQIATRYDNDEFTQGTPVSGDMIARIRAGVW